MMVPLIYVSFDKKVPDKMPFESKERKIKEIKVFISWGSKSKLSIVKQR